MYNNYYMDNKLTIVPKNIKFGKYGGLYYKNTKGKYTWLKPTQKKKAEENILRGGYGFSYMNDDGYKDQIYIPNDKYFNTELIPVLKNVQIGPKGGLFYYNRFGKKIYLNKAQIRDYNENILKGGY